MTRASAGIEPTQAPSLAVEFKLPLDRFTLDVSFRSMGPVVGIFGPSGAGKTSLLEAIAGLRRDATGLISVRDATLLDSGAGLFTPPESRGIGYVPQDGLLFPHLDVRGNLLSGASRARRSGLVPEERLTKVADVLEIGALLDQDVGSLSGGERQRVALGRALCSGPRLLLLDEPLASLDLPLRRRLLPVLRRLLSAFPLPTLIVSHDPVEVQALCDEILVLESGRIVAQGDPRDVLSDPTVYPLAEVDVVRTVLSGRIAGHDGSTSTIAFAAEDGGQGATLITMPAAGAIGDEVLVSIAASEIILSSEAVYGLSARNVLPATVAAVRGDSAHVLITAILAAGIPPLAIEVTRATVQEMGLAPGREIHVIIKAASCGLIE